MDVPRARPVGRQCRQKSKNKLIGEFFLSTELHIVILSYVPKTYCSAKLKNIQSELSKSVIKFEQVGRARWLSVESCVFISCRRTTRVC